MTRIPGAERPGPGIYAHTYFNHADGAWLVLYSWLRLEAGMAPDEAYEEAVRLASIPERSIVLPEPRLVPGSPVEPAMREALEATDLMFPELG